MTRKRYDHPNDRIADTAPNNVELPSGSTLGRDDDPNTVHVPSELYSRVGATFPVNWEPWSPAEPVIETDDLPSGVSESDVESALSAMKTDGVI